MSPNSNSCSNDYGIGSNNQLGGDGENSLNDVDCMLDEAIMYEVENNMMWSADDKNNNPASLPPPNNNKF